MFAPVYFSLFSYLRLAKTHLFNRSSGKLIPLYESLLNSKQDYAKLKIYLVNDFLRRTGLLYHLQTHGLKELH